MCVQGDDRHSQARVWLCLMLASQLAACGGIASEGSQQHDGPAAPKDVGFDVVPVAGMPLGDAGYVISDSAQGLVAAASLGDWGERSDTKPIHFKVPLSPGEGYSAIVVTNPPNWDESCRTTFSPFDVTTGVPLTLRSSLLCISGGVGQFPPDSSCEPEALVKGLRLEPIATSTGGVITLGAPNLDERPDDITYQWSLDAGFAQLTSDHSESSSLVCQAAGEVGVSLTMKRGVCAYVRHAAAFCLAQNH